MNAFQRCPNTNDAVPFYLPQQLFLKPIARLNVSIQLSQQKIMGKTITNWELMERMREMIKPDEFTVLKVIKTTVEVIRFEAEVEHKNKIIHIISKLDNKMIKLKDFPDLLKIRAAVAKSNFPIRHEWDSYFRDAKDMNEMKPGERPDTVHISNLPSKWFVPYHLSEDQDLIPSEKLFYRIFEKYGSIRHVDIPRCDPYRYKMKSQISGFQTSSVDEKDFFEGYVQFKDYVGFTTCMEGLKGMKLLCKEDEGSFTVNIYVDFDKTKHLCDASIRRREIVRDRMVLKEQSKDEKERETEINLLQKEKDLRDKEINKKSDKEKRRRDREEKRKAKFLAELKIKGNDDISEKIAKEEKKLMLVQRKLESIRLVEELFKRIKSKTERAASPLNKKKKGVEDELTKMKNISEQEVKNQREKLHQAIGGRVVLKSILSSQSRRRRDSSTSESGGESPTRKQIVEEISPQIVYPPMFDPNWYNYQPNNNPNNVYYHPAQFLNPHGGQMGRGNYFPYNRGRGLRALPAPGPSRGMSYQTRNNFNPNYRGRGRGGGSNHFLQQDFFKYAQKYLEEHLQSEALNYERQRSRSRSRSRRRSYSRSRRTYSRSKSRSRSRNRSRSRSRSRRSASHWTPDNKRRSHSRSRSNHRGRSKSKTRSVSKQGSVSRRSGSKSGSRRSRSKTRSKSKDSLKSVDSSKFVSPNRLRKSRSKS